METTNVKIDSHGDENQRIVVNRGPAITTDINLTPTKKKSDKAYVSSVAIDKDSPSPLHLKVENRNKGSGTDIQTLKSAIMMPVSPSRGRRMERRNSQTAQMMFGTTTTSVASNVPPTTTPTASTCSSSPSSSRTLSLQQPPPPPPPSQRRYQRRNSAVESMMFPKPSTTLTMLPASAPNQKKLRLMTADGLPPPPPSLPRMNPEEALRMAQGLLQQNSITDEFGSPRRRRQSMPWSQTYEPSVVIERKRKRRISDAGTTKTVA